MKTIILSISVFTFLLFNSVAQQNDYSQLRNDAETEYAQGSYSRANELYSKVDKSKLNRTEQQNVELLAQYESKVRERLATQPLEEGILGDMFAEDLRVLRNEIYARHGRIFKDAELQKYFESQAWYKPNPDFKDDQLNEIEAANLAKIKSAEDSATSKFSEAEG